MVGCKFCHELSLPFGRISKAVNDLLGGQASGVITQPFKLDYCLPQFFLKPVVPETLADYHCSRVSKAGLRINPLKEVPVRSNDP